jgi:hypothetical protein
MGDERMVAAGIYDPDPDANHAPLSWRERAEAAEAEVARLRSDHADACNLAWRLYCAATCQTNDSFVGIGDGAVADVERYVADQAWLLDAAEARCAALEGALRDADRALTRIVEDGYGASHVDWLIARRNALRALLASPTGEHE